MANVDAWSAGWGIGERASKTKKKKSAKTGGQASDLSASWDSYHKGGKVRRTGPAKLKKGEIVLTASQAKMCAGKASKKKGARKRITTKG